MYSKPNMVHSETYMKAYFSELFPCDFRDHDAVDERDAVTEETEISESGDSGDTSI